MCIKLRLSTRLNAGYPAFNTHHLFLKNKKYTQVTVKTKADASKENQCTTLWLFNGFLSTERNVEFAFFD